MRLTCISDKCGINFKSIYDADIWDQQPPDHSNHRPVSKDLLFVKLAPDVSGG